MNIKTLRKKKGMTRATLAAAVGVSITTMQNWENQTSKPNAENQKKLDSILG